MKYTTAPDHIMQSIYTQHGGIISICHVKFLRQMIPWTWMRRTEQFTHQATRDTTWIGDHLCWRSASHQLDAAQGWTMNAQYKVSACQVNDLKSWHQSWLRSTPIKVRTILVGHIAGLSWGTPAPRTYLTPITSQKTTPCHIARLSPKTFHLGPLPHSCLFAYLPNQHPKRGLEGMKW